jgi:predicted outer membrane protein
MKSYFLEDIASHQDVLKALSQLLAGQQRPWLLRGLQGDVMAYFNAHPSESDPIEAQVA